MPALVATKNEAKGKRFTNRKANPTEKAEGKKKPPLKSAS